ncbi:MAG: TolC family protein [Fibrobacter sp.]|uniref:TolC family protein n=1 Tax=Fibrobacter sp. TaxID=35828 RepID=UPI001B1786E7|nr:TolC family protein [Fibrobacter sp.]MBO7062267.1 TolC family protein [Fibrobacter sp.]
MRLHFTFSVFVSVAAVAAPLSLQDALNMAKSGNSQIKAEKAKVEMAESGKNEARSRFMPTVTLSAGVTKINDPININLNEIRSGIISVHGAEAYQEYYKTGYDAAYQRATGAGMPEDMAIPISKGVGDSVGMLAKMKTESALDSALPDFKKKVQDDVFFNARLSVVWPIFTGLKIYSAYDAAKENVNARKAEFDMAQNAILMDVATRYFSLRLAEELTLLRETTKRNLEGHLERSKKLEEGGQISKAERLRAEVALAEAQNALEDAMRDQTLARLALASLLHTDTSITATTPVESPEEYRSIEELKAMAREKHPGLRQLRTERKRSKAAVSAARADYFPTVALFGYKELYTKDLTMLEPEWAVGAKAQWDLFKGGETHSKVSSAKALDRSLASMEEQTLDNINLLVEKRWREMEHAKSRLVSLQKTRELADEALRSQNKAYEAGLATGLDVVDAELALSRLQVADLKAHYDAVIAWLGLLESCGEVENAGTLLTKSKPVAPVQPVASPADSAAAAPAAAVSVPATAGTAGTSVDSAAAPATAETPATAEAPAAADAPAAGTPAAEGSSEKGSAGAVPENKENKQ